MGLESFSRFPNLISEAEDILGYQIIELCLKGPDDQLGLTEFTQPALYLTSYLSALSKLEEGLIPLCAAGHSVGEFAALAVANAISFSEGLRMVSKRGEIMSQVQGGAMAAIIGLTVEEISEVLTTHELHEIDFANYNSPGQIVLSGPKDQIELSTKFIKQSGARLVVPLKVSGAFHSRQMNRSSEKFKEFLKSFSFSLPSFPVYSNVKATPYDDPEKISDLLVRQMHSPVRWTEIITNMRKNGVADFLECGPGKVLTKLLRQIP